MKMQSVCIASLLCIFSPATANVVGQSASLRGKKIDKHKNIDQKGPDSSGSFSAAKFGLTFRDSPFGGENPYVSRLPDIVVQEMNPIAPYDALDKHLVPSWSGSAPVSPGSHFTDNDHKGYTHPDFVPPYLHPKPFPQETDTQDKNDVDASLEDSMVVQHMDTLRMPGSLPEIPYINPNPLGAYPLVAPGDRMSPGPWPVAHLDKVPQYFDKFFDQSAEREHHRKKKKMLADAYGRVDTDDDNAITSGEYDVELMGHQKKTEEQAQTLWHQYKSDGGPDMTQKDFMDLAKTGYDLGQQFIKRKDLSGILRSPQAADMGFWGGGATCADGNYIKGVQIKVQTHSATADNTALNCVKFKCQDNTVIQTAEGPDGEWTEWAECPAGQTISSLSVRVQPYKLGQDNTGINDLMFSCRSKGQDKSTTLKFGDATKPDEEQKGYVFVNGKYVKKSSTTVDDKKEVVGAGKVATEGGWSEEMSCGLTGSLCGAQGRVDDVQGAKDNMGVTDFRFFCCSKSVKCSTPCKSPFSTACKACQANLDILKGR